LTAGDPKKLAALLKRLRAGAGGVVLTPPPVAPDAPDGFDDLLHELVFSMMLWETTTTHAKNAVRKLREHFADANELRVCMPDDTVQCLGERYPLARERALRLRHALHDVFQRQQVLSLAALHAVPRKDAAAFLESLDGMPLFVAQRVCVVSLEGHACPVDGRMRDHLAAERIVPEGVPAAEVSRFIAQHTRAEDALSTYLLLQQWSDERVEKAEGRKRATKGESHADGPRKKKAKAAPARKGKGAKP
jgi:hypothetical protein